MKNRRILILALMLITLGASVRVQAQEALTLSLEEANAAPTFDKTRFGVKVAATMGYSLLTNTDFSTPSLKNKYGDPTYGYKFGGVFEYQYTKNFAMDISLMYVLRGYKNDHTNDYSDAAYVGNQVISNAADFETTLQTFEIPLLLTYKANFDKWRPYAQMGPYINLAVGGTTKRKYEATGDEWISEDVEIGFRAWELQRDEWGMKFGLGAEIKNYRIGAGFDLGSTNYKNSAKQSDKVRYATIDFIYFF